MLKSEHPTALISGRPSPVMALVLWFPQESLCVIKTNHLSSLDLVSFSKWKLFLSHTSSLFAPVAIFLTLVCVSNFSLFEVFVLFSQWFCSQTYYIFDWQNFYFSSLKSCPLLWTYSKQTANAICNLLLCCLSRPPFSL